MESLEISAFLPSSTEKESPMQQFMIFNLTGTDRGIDISKSYNYGSVRKELTLDDLFLASGSSTETTDAYSYAGRSA